MTNTLIIGPSSGIGAALAKQLTAEGHHVFGTFNKNTPTTDGFSKLQQLNVLDQNPDLSFVPDVLDGLVYCPGAVNLKPFPRIKPEEFVADYQLQLLGAVKVIQACKKEANAQRHPLKKIGRPEDLANLAAFLLSEKSSWITGQILHADGGVSSVKKIVWQMVT